MSLSAGAINSGPSALNERLCLVEPKIYQPSEPRLILLSAPSHPSPGRRIISRAHVNPIGSARRITWHRASSKRRNFIDRGPMGDIWLSLVQCAASNRRTHRGISRVSLQNIRNRGLDGGERERFEPLVPRELRAFQKMPENGVYSAVLDCHQLSGEDRRLLFGTILDRDDRRQSL
jgi:hypothetical protein